MNKKIIVAAIAAAIAAPLTASADAIVYGNVRVASQYHERSGKNTDAWGLQDQISRLGIKGDEDLGSGLKAIYKLEFAINAGNGCTNDTCNNHGSPTQRNVYVGLDSGFGTFLAGRNDTPFKLSTAKLDFFPDTAADNDNGTYGYAGPGASAQSVSLFQSLRVDGALAYISPSFAGFKLAGAAVQRGTAGFTTNDKADTFAGAYSLAAMYDNGPWTASLAYETIDPESLAGVVDSSKDTKWRLGLGMLNFHNFSAGFVYEGRHDVGFVDGVDSKAWQLSLAYDFLGNNRVKAMYGQYEYDLGSPLPAATINRADGKGFDTWAIGLQHSFTKRTDVEVLYRQKTVDAAIRDLGPNDNVFAVQMNHAF